MILVSSFININNVNNIKVQEVTTYTNDQYGFKVQYPLNWITVSDFSGETGKAVLDKLKEMGEPTSIVGFCHTGLPICTALTDDSKIIAVFDKLKKSDRSLEKVLH